LVILKIIIQILRNKKIVLLCSGIIIGSVILTSSDNIVDDNEFKYVPNIETKIIIDNNENTINNSEELVTEEIIEQNANENITNNNTTNANINESSNTINMDNESTISKTNPSVQTVTIYRSNGNIINIELEEYIVGVVAAEMPASFNLEALKAGAVIARTYALKAKSINKNLTDTVSTQEYIDIDQMKEKWGTSFNTYYNKIKNAVNSTNGEYLTYNGNYIEAMYHSTSNGTTESSLDVFNNYYPYLINVDSSYDLNAPSYLRTTTFDINTVNNTLGLNLNNDSNIEIISKTSGGNIKEISIDGKIFTGKEIREKLSLRSTDFDISINNSIVTITTRGYGHGVGMSQYGANEMAKLGYNYKNILSHYYPNTELKN
jgi:stage II sporulation protein D